MYQHWWTQLGQCLLHGWMPEQFVSVAAVEGCHDFAALWTAQQLELGHPGPNGLAHLLCQTVQQHWIDGQTQMCWNPYPAFEPLHLLMSASCQQLCSVVAAVTESAAVLASLAAAQIASAAVVAAADVVATAVAAAVLAAAAAVNVAGLGKIEPLSASVHAEGLAVEHAAAVTQVVEAVTQVVAALTQLAAAVTQIAAAVAQAVMLDAQAAAAVAAARDAGHGVDETAAAGAAAELATS